jgi:alpha-beta hydrolase superfamily lysophospholipase
MESVAAPVTNETFGLELVRDWAPAGEARATFVLVHGLAEHSGRYERTGSLLSDAGFHVRSFDLVGAGASGGERWDIDDWSRYHDQIQGHVEWAIDQRVPVVLMGHSLGGLLVLGYLYRERPKPDLAVLSAPFLGGAAAWQRALAPIGAKLAPTLAVPNRLKGEQLSRDPAVGEAYFADPLVYTKTSSRLGSAIFDELDEVRSLLAAAPVPTLVLHGSADTIAPPQHSAILGETPGFERRLYQGLRHEILNEPEGPEVVADIVAWVDARI